MFIDYNKELINSKELHNFAKKEIKREEKSGLKIKLFRSQI